LYVEIISFLKVNVLDILKLAFLNHRVSASLPLILQKYVYFRVSRVLAGAKRIHNFTLRNVHTQSRYNCTPPFYILLEYLCMMYSKQVDIPLH